jgi:hypothetical protein
LSARPWAYDGALQNALRATIEEASEKLLSQPIRSADVVPLEPFEVVNFAATEALLRARSMQRVLGPL